MILCLAVTKVSVITQYSTVLVEENDKGDEHVSDTIQYVYFMLA